MRSEYCQPPTTGSIGPLVPRGGLPLAGPGLQAASDWSAGPGVSSAAAGGWLGGDGGGWSWLWAGAGLWAAVGHEAAGGWDQLSGAREPAEAAHSTSMTRPRGRVSPDLSS